MENSTAARERMQPRPRPVAAKAERSTDSGSSGLVALLLIVLIVVAGAGTVTATHILGAMREAAATKAPSAAPTPIAPVKWEYRIEQIADDTLARKLDELGADRWELSSARRAVDGPYGQPFYECILKRTR